MTIDMHLKVSKFCMKVSAKKEMEPYYTEHTITGMHGRQYEQTKICHPNNFC